MTKLTNAGPESSPASASEADTGRTVELADEQATERCAAALANHLTAGLLITLNGDLGAGKTSFVRAVLRSLGHQGPVKSPTYTIVEPYAIAGLEINHFDLYRLGDIEELELMGFRDYLNAQTICFVEWPQRAGNYLPVADLNIDLLALSGSNITARQLHCVANSEAGVRLLRAWAI
ncbi:MAG: tRNA (adenosine(37)-N6)-threonylcarbamoyltransferase complex ATPase subunit type 1 TsaE [Pseudomonadales bacterium]